MSEKGASFSPSIRVREVGKNAKIIVALLCWPVLEKCSLTLFSQELSHFYNDAGLNKVALYQEDTL